MPAQQERMNLVAGITRQVMARTREDADHGADTSGDDRP